MEEKIYQTCLDPAIQILEKLQSEQRVFFYAGHPLITCRLQIQTMRMELRFFKMFIWGLAYWEKPEYDWHLNYAISTMMPKLSQTAEQLTIDFERVGCEHQEINWEQMTCDLEKRIQQFKPQVKEICFHLLGRAFKCKSCQQCNQELFLEYGRETDSFIDFILRNLTALLDSNFNLIDPMKQQISFIQQKLKEFGRFANPINHSITRVKKLYELMSRTRTCATHISCLTCLYWIDGRDENLTSITGTMLSNLMHKLMPHTPGVIASYLEVTIIHQLLARYFDFLLEDLVIPMKDNVQNLSEGLTFLLSFVVDPPEEDSEDKELILALIYSIINELPSLICSITFDKMKEGTYKANFSSFLQMIDDVRAKIRSLYVMTPRSSQFNSPKTNLKGFLDSLLRTLKKMLEAKVNFIPSVEHQVEIVQKELALLRPFLQSNVGLQNEHRKLKDLWTRTVDVAYYAAYVTNLCLARSFSMWYGIASLPNVIEHIKIINAEFQKIENHETYKNKVICVEIKSNIALSPQAMTSKLEGAFIGFKMDARLIIDYLLRGRKDLTIISISGLPGQGKTTLAKRIYDDAEIQYHFSKIVWCYVSKECKPRELLIKIGRDLIGVNVTNLEFEDLAVSLRKSLKQRRYLIVMDDIWDVDVWNQVQMSFPNDKNGSRILFTSRNDDLASQTELNFIPHRLRLFSEEESWELMKERLFSYRGAPLEFSKIAQQIASYCKGLPLAIALIASLLQRTERKLHLWNKVAKNLKSHLASEGCREIIELSYEYLSDHLKSCFLYFGAFPRGKNIHASKLKKLWIAEGFIKDNEMYDSKDLANEYLDNLANKYLDDLISQNLVVVAKRSSIGGIKMCNVHDLLYDLCLEKAKEENFLNWVEESFVVDPRYSCPQKYSHHRLCIRREDTFVKSGPICTRKELPTSTVHSLVWVDWDRDFPLHPTLECLSHFLQSFKILKVLDLSGVYLKCDRFPNFILSIIHLKYLALNISHEIDGIPPSIADLWNLETLIVKGWGFYYLLPNSMWEMKSLRHVEIFNARLHLEDFEENNPFTTSNIETLVLASLVYDSKTEEFLKKLPRLRKLVCYYEKFHPLWFSMFGSLTKLECLKINGRYGGGLVSHEKYNFHQNLKKLTLYGLHLPWSAMSIIGKQLPNLQVLKLYNNACSGSRWNLENEGFSKLRYLNYST